MSKPFGPSLVSLLERATGQDRSAERRGAINSKAGFTRLISVAQSIVVVNLHLQFNTSDQYHKILKNKLIEKVALIRGLNLIDLFWLGVL